WRVRNRCAAKWDGQPGSRWKTSPGTASSRRFMTATPARSHVPEGCSVGAAAAYVVTHGWQVFITDWNWKTALFSALFRVAVWPTTKLAGGKLIAPGALRGLLIELLFRLAIGGFWGSLLQAFATAQPAWLAGLCVVVVLPGCAHGFEYLFL